MSTAIEWTDDTWNPTTGCDRVSPGCDHCYARPVDADWVRDLRDRSTASGIAFLFKQWGGRTPKANGRELDGRTWDEYPT